MPTADARGVAGWGLARAVTEGVTGDEVAWEGGGTGGAF